MATSRVEETLLTQRDTWREVSDRVGQITARELPPEQPKRILLFGEGSSHFAARLIGYSLIRDKSRVRIPVHVCSSTHVGLDVLPQKGDWAFALTHRGGTPSTLRAMEMCSKVGAFTIQVSAQGVRENEHALMVLPTSKLEVVEPHTVAVTGAACAVTSLLGGMKAAEEWEALRTIGDPSLDALRGRAAEGPSVLVGEWEGEWLAREGALKLMEMARLPVLVFGSEEYFHGPSRAFGTGGATGAKIWHVSLPKDGRNGDLQPAHRIGIFGSSPLNWVPALVELQWLALAVAMNLGVNPDGAA
ncbi:MAG: SIS domain-containing protein [Bdellovibrionota bacterium]